MASPGRRYSVQADAAVNSPTSLTLSASAGTQTGAAYLATAIGQDGNTIALYELHKTTTAYLTPAGSSQMTGGAEPQPVTSISTSRRSVSLPCARSS